MGERLYGMDPLFDELVPGLVGLDRKGGRRPRVATPGHLRHRTRRRPVQRQDQPAGRPVRRLRPLVPLVRADLAVPGFGDPFLAGLPDARPDGSHLTDLLYLLSYKLGLRVRRTMQRLRFPRLSLGLLVVTAWRADETSAAATTVSPQDLRRAEQRLRDVISRNGDDQGERRARLAEWIQALERDLPAGATGLGPLEGAGRAALRTAAPRLLPSQVNRGALRWWDDHLRHEQGDAVQKLFGFVRDFRRPGGDRLPWKRA